MIFMMQSKKVKRIFLLILLLGLLYNLFVTSTHQWAAHLRKHTIQNIPTTEVVNTSEVFTTHVSRPLHLEDKKLPSDQVYEPSQIGFLPELQQRHQQKIPNTEVVNTSKVFATHVSTPLHFKDQKLPSDSVSEPRQVGFLQELKQLPQQKIPTVEVVNNSEVFTTHVAMPPHFKGKKLTSDLVYEPSQIGFLPEIKKRHHQKIPNYKFVKTSQVFATHVSMPPPFKGKKLTFDQVYEPSEIGFLPERHHQKIPTFEIVNTSEVFATHAALPPHFKGKKLTFDRVYEPRQVGFLPELKPVSSNHTTKTILLWTKWNSLRKTINYYFLQPGNRSFVKHNCPNPHCRATFNRKLIHRVDAVLFHLIDTKTDEMPSSRSPHQVWILYNMEPPWQVQKHKSSELSSLDNLFNWTMGYGGNSDIVARYGFIEKSSAAVSLDYAFTEKTKDVVWFVSDCSTDSRREDYVKELRKFIDIDIFGKCGHCKCYPSQSSSCYEGVLQSYKFYLSFENAICRDYVTEKFFNVFNYNIVPVVFGGANYSVLAPEGSFIDATKYPQPKVLAEVLIEVANNETIYTEYLTKKMSFRAYLDPWMCKLCNKLHSYRENSTLKNVSKWLDQDGQCNKWNISSQAFIYQTI